jgi:hypothetical protein
MEARTPTSLVQVIRYFADPEACLRTMVAVRWPDGVKCPTCDSEKVAFLANQYRWQCSAKHPKRQFSAKVGTVFEDSPIGFDKWLPVIMRSDPAVAAVQPEAAAFAELKLQWLV